ncbi:N-acetyl sugar amidotransferase [bacterium SCSIO 12741]|nr:N-acetyl sugar amidotransferase [bacterium SCSIO 12741]
MKVCNRCVLDESVPDIKFDKSGECNYCKAHDLLSADYPLGEKGKADWEALVAEMKKNGKGKQFDCIVGVSGGTDSTYLLLLAKEMGLRPLAVTFDNGWHSEIAVNNIKKALDILNIELRTYVMNWDEMKGIHRSFMKASLPWPDGTTDIGITSALYRIAAKEGVKHVLIGHDFRSEGKQPEEWTYVDAKMVKHIARKNKVKLKSYPNLTMFDYLYYGMVKGIKNVRPFWYLPYDKPAAKKIIEEKVDWEYYGGHHHENIFTKFIISYWLPKKFGFDKRKVTLSALVRSGMMEREDALKELAQPPYDPEQMEEDREYVMKKLDISEEEFQEMWNAPNKKFTDYPSYFPFYNRYKKLILWVFKYILPFKPMTAYDVDEME